MNSLPKRDTLDELTEFTGLRSFSLNLWPLYLQLRKHGFMYIELNSMGEHLQCDC